jgi:uracil-DNA glycosylase family 4
MVKKMITQQKKQHELDELYKQYTQHSQCPLGRTDHHNLIFGTGNPNARFMIIGEAPGKTEEEQGLPFVGRSGKLLTTILTSLHINRSEIFITNIVKCRPQNNRTPTIKEIDAYRDLLYKQIDIIQPTAICTLGAVALQALLPDAPKITAARGIFFYYKKFPVMPTYHPAYILRNAESLPLFKKDITKAVTIVKKLGGG